jgi:hypothetical protein
MQTTGRRLRDHSEDMSDDNQTVIARSFIELFIPAGAVKPRETQVVIAERYGWCEDMAQMLTEHARSKHESSAQARTQTRPGAAGQE